MPSVLVALPNGPVFEIPGPPARFRDPETYQAVLASRHGRWPQRNWEHKDISTSSVLKMYNKELAVSAICQKNHVPFL